MPCRIWLNKNAQNDKQRVLSPCVTYHKTRDKRFHEIWFHISPRSNSNKQEAHDFKIPEHSFIPDIYIVHLQETYSEALSVQLRPKRNVKRGTQKEVRIHTRLKRLPLSLFAKSIAISFTSKQSEHWPLSYLYHLYIYRYI